ncbi:MAG: hypothetical protein JWN70_780 [Planctomycetaceae bacterium]|nr:hypothetical protein [Planctomycetaceae bacterium]
MRTMALIMICALMATATLAADAARTVTVSAQSEFRVAPDEAIIIFSIETGDDKLLLAKGANDSRTLALKNTIKALPRPVDDFKVTSLTVRDRRDENGTLIEGSTVTRSFEIRTTDFTQIDQIIGDIADAVGDNLRIGDLRLQVRDQRKAQFESRRIAVEIAKEKASHLAELNQMKIGRAITIREGVEYNPYAGAMGGMALSANAIPDGEYVGPIAQRLHPQSRVQNIHVIRQQTKSAKEKVSTPDPKATEKENLLLPGLVILNSTVTIEFEMLPKE